MLKKADRRVKIKVISTIGEGATATVTFFKEDKK